MGLSGEADGSYADLVWRCRVLVRALIDRPEDPQERCVADALGTSRRTLQRAFQLAGDGLTLRRAVERARVQAGALKLRGSPRRPVAYIAERVGYSHATHFSAAFKRRYGVSPREYRAQEAERERRYVGFDDLFADFVDDHDLWAELVPEFRELRSALLARYDRAKR